jgi:hypothetical protein
VLPAPILALTPQTHITPPLRRKEDALNHVLDRRNGSLQFYYEVPAILRDLHAREIHIAVASRTGAIDLYVLSTAESEYQGQSPRSLSSVEVLSLTISANEALALLSIPGPGTQASPVAARSYFKTVSPLLHLPIHS